MSNEKPPSSYGLLSEEMELLENWTWGEAQQADKAWQEDHPRASRTRPIAQWSVWHNLLPDLRTKYESDGDSKALFRAIGLCGSHGLPLPSWCSSAINRASDAIEGGTKRGWDDYFGAPNKDRQLPKLRAKHKRMSAILMALDKIDAGSDVEKTLREVATSCNDSYETLRSEYYQYRKAYPITQVIAEEGTYQKATGAPDSSYVRVRATGGIDQTLEIYIAQFGVEPNIPFGVSDESASAALEAAIERGEPIPKDFDWYSYLPPNSTA